MFYVLRSRVILFFILLATFKSMTIRRMIFRSKKFRKASYNLISSEIFNKIFCILHNFPYLHFPSLHGYNAKFTVDKFIRESSVYNRIVRFRLCCWDTLVHALAVREEESRGFSLPLKVAHPPFGHVISILARCLRFLRARLTYDRGDLAY